VPVELADPPITDVGLKVTLVGVFGCTVSVPVTDVPFELAEIFAVVVLGTAAVVTVKFALADPAGTVTVGGSIAIAEPPLVTDNDTTVLCCTAAPNVTVPVEVSPPVSDEGEKVRDVMTDGMIVSTAVRTVSAEAEIVAVVFTLTALVFTVKVPLVAPAGTTRLDGTVATGLSLLRPNVTPELVAFPTRKTCPVDGVVP